MRPDKERRPPDSYWTHDRALGVATLFGQRAPIRLKAHLSIEHYQEPTAINHVRLPRGERTFIFAHPYIRLPEHPPSSQYVPADPELDALFGLAAPDNPRSVEHSLGIATALYYPARRTLLLWEVELTPAFRPQDPGADSTYQTLWQGFERTLLELFPDTLLLATPDWDPHYAEHRWQRFLVTMGYLPHLMHEQLFMKPTKDA
jgi:hypothetical protein